MLRGKPLGGNGEDVARPALGLVLGLLLDPAQGQTRLVARLLLDLGDQQLLRLGGREPRDPLELAQLVLAGLLQFLGLLGKRALAVVERADPALEIFALNLDRMRVAKRPLLHPRDLCASRLQLAGTATSAALAGSGATSTGASAAALCCSTWRRHHPSPGTRISIVASLRPGGGADFCLFSAGL
jgi:hypothetical protein